MSAKKIGLLLSGIVFIFGFYFLADYLHEGISQKQLVNFDNQLTFNEKPASKTKSEYRVVGNDNHSNTHTSTSSAWNPMGDPIASAEIKKWFAERGNYSFYGPEALSDYEGYGIETLVRLSDAGDIKAMHVMADRTNNFEELRKILWKAAIHGSTAALIRLGSLNENDEGSLTEKPVERQKEKILDMLAYYEVAQIRGDWWGNMAIKSSLKDRFPVELSESDKQLVRKAADQIYDSLQAQRTEAGLGDFDNSVPDSVIKFYEEMLRPL